MTPRRRIIDLARELPFWAWYAGVGSFIAVVIYGSQMLPPLLGRDHETLGRWFLSAPVVFYYATWGLFAVCALAARRRVSWRRLAPGVVFAAVAAFVVWAWVEPRATYVGIELYGDGLTTAEAYPAGPPTLLEWWDHRKVMLAAPIDPTFRGSVGQWRIAWPNYVAGRVAGPFVVFLFAVLNGFLGYAAYRLAPPGDLRRWLLLTGSLASPFVHLLIYSEIGALLRQTHLVPGTTVFLSIAPHAALALAAVVALRYEDEIEALYASASFLRASEPQADPIMTWEVIDHVPGVARPGDELTRVVPGIGRAVLHRLLDDQETDIAFTGYRHHLQRSDASVPTED